MPMELGILIAGVMVSGVGTLVGVGGGFLMVPLLRLVFDVPMHAAVAGCLAAIFPSACLSSIRNIQRGKVDFRIAGLIEVAAVVMAVAGSYAAHYVSADALRTVFGVAVGLIGLKLVVGLASGEDESEAGPGLLNRLPPFLHRAGTRHPISIPGTFGMGGVAGFLAGMLGIGGGFLKSPSLVHLFGLPADIAAATSLATVAVTAFVGSVSHYRLGHVEPHVTSYLVAGFLGGALLGSALDGKVDEVTRRKLIAFTLLVSGASMLLVPS